jgi:hypothetical protein
VTGSEIGWTNAPFNKSLGLALDSSCSTIATVTSLNNLTFTLTAAASPLPGTCNGTVTDFASGQSATVAITYASAGNQSFYFTGGPQTFVVPAGITSLTIDAYGAQGGGGGGGGETMANITVTPGESLTLFIGGYGGGQSGGFNGGGSATDGCNSGGGGATDLRQGGVALSNRVVVAGGGGGGGCDQSHGGGSGGQGGGSTGGTGADTSGSGSGFGGSGGDQSSGGIGGAGGNGSYNGVTGTSGSLGQGGAGGLGGGDYMTTCTALGGAGGGGGYYGGGGGGGGAGDVCPTNNTWGGGGGGGGSSHAEGSATQVFLNAGVQGGYGAMNITWPAYVIPLGNARRPAAGLQHPLIRATPTSIHRN